jgi:beta-glucosidase
MACVKHFALYGGSEAGREYNTVDMSRIKMYQYYLPPYKAAIDAGCGSVMSSFNEIDGIPATGNRWLLTGLLRNQWKFNGLVVSDYTSLSEMEAHGMGDLSTVSALALHAGLDMDMVSEGYLNTLKKSLQSGKITQKEIDQACRRILEAKYKLGLFKDPYNRMNADRAVKELLSPDNRKLSRKVAAHSFVLLKNNDQLLPLKKSGTIALVGPLADNHRNMLGTWSVSGDPSKSVTVMEGIKNVAHDVKIMYAKGANISDDSMLVFRTNKLGTEIEPETRTAEAMIDEAVTAAIKSDVVVAVIGEAADMSGESSSRGEITVPESQENLLKALVKTGKPLVVVLFNGRPLILKWENDHVGAILDAWFPGTEAGNAIADVLFGEYNPSGKLSMTFPLSQGQIPIYYNAKNTGRPYTTGDANTKFKSDYLDMPNDPLYPFGYGLSYTKFSYSPLSLSTPAISPAEPVTVKLTVTNSGNYDGEETVQLYIRDMVATVTQPVKELKKFQKVYLKKGESKEISFGLTTEDLKYVNSDLKWVYDPGAFKIFAGGNSRDVVEANLTGVLPKAPGPKTKTNLNQKAKD